MSDRIRGGHHPDDGTLASWLDGNLTQTEMESVREHLDSCDRCIEIVSEAATALEDLEVSETPSRPESGTTPVAPERQSASFRPIWLAAAVIVLAVVSGIVLLNRTERSSGRSSDLASSLPAERALEVRLAGADWRPLERALRGGTDEHSYELLAEVARIRERAASDPSQENMHELAAAYLILGDPERAVETLETAEASGTLSIEAWSDYAAALVAIGDRSEDARPCGRALDIIDTIDDGSTLEPTLAFNRALALECTGLLESAADAWSQYLDLDPSSGWSAEARDHLDRLQRDLDTTAPEGTDDLVDRVADEILPEWGQAVLAGDLAEADRLLTLAQELSGRAGEGALLATIEQLKEGGTPESAEAHAIYGRARRAYKQGNIQEAESLAQRVVRRFHESGSPFTGFPRMLAASCAYYRNDFSGTEEWIDSIVIDDRSPILAGRIEWMRAIVTTSREERQSAIRAFERAQSSFAQAGATASAATMAIYLAEALLSAGRAEESWRLLATAAPSAHTLPPLRHYQLYEVMATAAVASDFRALASEVARQALRVAERSGRPDVIAGALALPSGHARSAPSLNGLSRAVSSISDDVLRVRTSTVLDVWTAELMAGTDPHEAARAASRALESEATDDVLRSRAHLYRGLARARIGEDEGAIHDLATAIRLMDARTRAAESEVERVRARDTQAIAWSAWIDLLWSSDRKLDALEKVLEARNAPSFETGPMAPRTVRLVLWPSEERTLAWIESGREEARSFELPIGQERVKAIVQLLNKRQSGESLSSLLAPFTPIASAVAEEHPRSVLILATPPFDQLPWAAVPAGRGPLVSATNLSLTLGKAGGPLACGQRHLVAAIGSGGAVGELAPLPYVDDELSLVRHLYGSQESLGTGCGVLHYAGHARSEGTRNELFISGHSVTPSELFTRLPHDVAVLSACRTAGGLETKLSGTLSHARELLSNGTSTVMATLWPVADGESREMLETLHTGLRDGSTTAEALAQAQRQLIRNGANDRAWAAWIHLTS